MWVWVLAATLCRWGHNKHKASLIAFSGLSTQPLTWCTPPGSGGQVRFPRSLLAAMTTPALCQIPPWQQAEWGATGACTCLMAQKEMNWVEVINNMVIIRASAVKWIPTTHIFLPCEAVLMSLGMLGRPSPAQPYAPTVTLYFVFTLRLPMSTS